MISMDNDQNYTNTVNTFFKENAEVMEKILQHTILYGEAMVKSEFDEKTKTMKWTLIYPKDEYNTDE